jgi:hypothetical protein
MSYRVLRDPTFSIETGELLSHNGESFVEDFPIKADRSIQSSAKNNANTANNTASQYGAQAAGIGSSLIPGLERDANNPQGFSPTQKNDMLVSGAEAVGGANSGITGQANLTAARTRNAGGFANALDEAARIKGRQLSTNALNVSGADAKAALAKQAQARGELGGLYGTDVSGQLKGMGLANEDLDTALKAGQSGWQQNAMGWINAFSNAGQAAAKDKEAFG